LPGNRWSYATLLKAANAHFQAVADNDDGRARQTLDELRLALSDASVHGVRGGLQAPAVGAALAREASTVAKAGDGRRANELADLAVRAAPDDVTVAARVALVRLKTDGFRAAGTLVDIVQRTAFDPLRAADIAARLLACAIFAALVMLFSLVVAVALPALRLLVADVLALLPTATHPLQGAFFIAMVAAAPVLFQAGLVTTCLWIVSLGFVYLTTRARVFVCCCGVVLLALPLAAGLFARAVTFAESDADVIAAALFDVGAEAEREQLAVREQRGDKLPLFGKAALADAARREGRLDESLARWLDIVQTNANQAWVHGGYAVALASAGRDALALTELTQTLANARKSEPLFAVASFNAATLHERAGSSSRAQASIDNVGTSGAEHLAQMRRSTFRNPDEVVSANRMYVGILPPRHAVMRALLDDDVPRSVPVFATAARLLWGPLTERQALGLTAAFLVAWLVLAWRRTQLRPAFACTQCGVATTRRGPARVILGTQCATCAQIFPTKPRADVVVDAAVRVAKEKEIFRRGRRQARVILLLSILPGMGHLYAGALWRGAFAVVFVAGTAVSALVTSDLFPGPAPPGAWPPVLLSAVCLAVFAIGVLVIVHGARVLAESHRSGKA
jgi:hypothetical protein